MSVEDDRWARNFEQGRKRLTLKERAVALLGGKCQACGYDRCPAAMDFHHPDSLEKDFEISSRTSWSPTLEAELRKTVLLCANCHREAHAGWLPQFMTYDEGGADLGEELRGVPHLMGYLDDAADWG